jgi:eight-cysteine-cluster-containing protein
MTSIRSTLGAILFLATCGLAACGGPSKSPPTPPPAAGGGTPGEGACVRSGCSGTVCVKAGEEVVTTCEYRPEYACYDQAKCEPQADGACGWTATPELQACLGAGGPTGSGGGDVPY